MYIKNSIRPLGLYDQCWKKEKLVDLELAKKFRKQLFLDTLNQVNFLKVNSILKKLRINY